MHDRKNIVVKETCLSNPIKLENTRKKKRKPVVSTAYNKPNKEKFQEVVHLAYFPIKLSCRNAIMWNVFFSFLFSKDINRKNSFMEEIQVG